jgi:hypothetical protein
MEQHHQHMIKMAEHLKLTKEQMEQIHEVLNPYFTELHALHGNKQITKEQAAARQKGLQEHASQSLKQILTADQLKMLEPHGGVAAILNGHQMMDPMHLLSKLGLNEKQTVEAKKIVSGTHEKMMAIHQDKNLSKADAELKMKQLHDATIKRLEGILTPDQQRKFKELVDAHRGTKGSKVIDPRG